MAFSVFFLEQDCCSVPPSSPPPLPAPLRYTMFREFLLTFGRFGVAPARVGDRVESDCPHKWREQEQKMPFCFISAFFMWEGEGERDGEREM